MTPLFPGEPAPPPEVRTAGSWRITAEDFGRPKPPPVQHALGYEAFVALAARYGTAAESLFDLWTFAHFIRAHRDRFEADPDLMHSAVVFLGNVCIANHPECVWSGDGPELAVRSPQEMVEDEHGIRFEPPDQRSLGVAGTVPAILDADEARFLEFQGVVDHWRPGAPVPRTRRVDCGPRDGE